MERLWQDVRYGLRTLGRTPGFTVVAILTLALGIGVNTSMFSVIDATMLGGLPYPSSSHLVRVFRTSPQSRSWPHSAPNVLDYQAQNTVFEKMAPFSWAAFNLAEPGQAPERVNGLAVGGDFFPVLGMPPLLGRTINKDDDAPGKNDVVVLSHGFWTRRYGADPGVVGRVVRFDGKPTTIVGVMPKGADYPFVWGPIDAWRPLALSDAQRQDRDNNWLSAISRLKPGVSIPEAQAAMNVLSSALKKTNRREDDPDGIRLVQLLEGSMDETGQTVSWMCLGLAGFVLLIACANIANLQIARAARRSREFAVRAALGAGRRRILRQSLTESLILGFGGGLVGLVLGWWGNDFLGKSIIIGERGVDVPLNLTILAYAATLSIVAGVVAGVVPSWMQASSDLGQTLKGSRGGEDRSQHRLRSALVVGQVGLALVLLAMSALFVRGLEQFTRRDPGWATQGLLAGYLNLPDKAYPDDVKRRAFQNRLLEELAAQPGVEKAALATSIPIWPYGSSTNLMAEGQPAPSRDQVPLFYYTRVSPDFFDTLGIPITAGGTFAAETRADGPRVAVINEAVARRFWPNENPIGKRLGYSGDEPKWREVVGVVRDVGFPASLGTADTPLQIYVPLEQEPSSWLTAVVRGSGGPEVADTLGAPFRRALAAVDADLPVADLATVPEHVRRGLSSFGLAGNVLTGFGILGLLLAALGVYGVIANVVVQRTREFGIRMAVGAQVRDVLWLVVSKGLRLTGLGVAGGLLGSFALARLMASAIPSLQSNSAAAILLMAALLTMVAIFACWLPAHRATRVDPLVALREE
jgi:predicted permease